MCLVASLAAGDVCCHPACCCRNVTKCPALPPAPSPASPYKTVAEIAAQWDEFIYTWLEARSTTGFWIEIGTENALLFL